MDHFSVKHTLATMSVLWDTREQNTQRSRKRMKQIGVPIERVVLPFGDYSAKCILPNGEVYSLERIVTIERKMDITELAHCYCQDRGRFTREFQRAKDAGAKVYLLIENGSLDAVYAGNYRSRVHPASLTASIFAWLSRYDCQILFCNENNTGKVIHDVLYRELKERLEGMPEDEHSTGD